MYSLVAPTYLLPVSTVLTYFIEYASRDVMVVQEISDYISYKFYAL